MIIIPAMIAVITRNADFFVISFSSTQGFPAIKPAAIAPRRYPGKKPPVGPSHTAMPPLPPEYTGSPINPASRNNATGAPAQMPPSSTAHKIHRMFCKTIGTTPIGILIKQPAQIIAANKAIKVVLKTDFFIRRIYQIAQRM